MMRRAHIDNSECGRCSTGCRLLECLHQLCAEDGEHDRMMPGRGCAPLWHRFRHGKAADTDQPQRGSIHHRHPATRSNDWRVETRPRATVDA